MGDAVLRVQKHLQELARDNFAQLEKAHGSNVEWLLRKLEALCREIDVTVTLDLKRPAPATFSSEYVFVAKKPRLETIATTAELPAPISPPPSIRSTAAAAPANAVTHVPVVTASSASAPPAQRQPEPLAQPSLAVTTTAAAAAAAPVTAKRMVTRVRRVMRPKQPARAKQKTSRLRLEPESMKVVELRAELKRRGLKAAGLKAVLVDRLLDALEDEASDGTSDDDDVVELEAVDEEYEEELEDSDVVDSGEAARSATGVQVTSQQSDTVESQPELSDVNRLHRGDELPMSASPRKSRDEIVRESLDELSLSQKSVANDPAQDAAASDDDADDDTQSTQGEDSVMLDAAGVFTAAVTKPVTNWTARRADAEALSRSAAGQPTTVAVSASASTVTGAGNIPDTSTASWTLASERQSEHDGASAALEKKAALKVSFAARNTVAANTDPLAAASSSPTHTGESASRSRSASLPQSGAHPVTPNGQGTTVGELPVARSEPMPALVNETDEQRRQREHELTIEREAQRLRIAAKLSAKKRFEEAKLSSSFWSKRERSKSHATVASVASVSGSAVAPHTEQAAVKTSVVVAAPIVTIKAEPEAPKPVNAVHDARMAMPVASASVEAEAKVSSSRSQHELEQQQQQTAAAAAVTQAAVKQEPRVKPVVTIPFAASSRRFSDPSRRNSASSRRESDGSSRRNSLTRRRDSVASTGSSASGGNETIKPTTTATANAAATGARKPSNLVSGLHSLTTLLEKENASAVSAPRSAPVVNALKLAERTRLLEQRKHLEKAKRKEALMKKYEEQRRLDDDRKKRAAAAAALGVKEKSERDAKLKREADKAQEKKQRELELAKRRQQKLQEMRAGLEKKRALLAAEKQQAKLAAQASRRTSTDSVQAAKAPTRPQTVASSSSSVSASSSVSGQPVKTSAANVQKSASALAPAAPLKSFKPASVAKPAPIAALAASAKPKQRPTDASTYDMSDNAESSDGDDSDDDDGDGRHNKKNIPRWARKENLERVLRVQFGPNASDPSPSIFPDFVDTCDLEAIFEPTDVRKKKRFAKRSSSGNWFGDRPTAREKALYKRDMGYLR